MFQKLQNISEYFRLFEKFSKFSSIFQKILLISIMFNIFRIFPNEVFLYCSSVELSGMCQNVVDGSIAFKYDPAFYNFFFHRIFQNVLVCSLNFQSCFKVFQRSLECLRFFPNTLECFRNYAKLRFLECSKVS